MGANEFIVNAITGTPLWVWGILTYLLYVGIKATRSRVIYLPKLFILPLVFIGLNYKTFITENNVIPDIIFMFAGFVIGFLMARRAAVTVFKDTKSIELPGDYYTIVIFLLFFSIKYIFGYLQAVHPATYIQYSTFEMYVGALFSGFFLGRSLCLVYRFIKAQA